jgi:FkbM family methyltransferase
MYQKLTNGISNLFWLLRTRGLRNELLSTKNQLETITKEINITKNQLAEIIHVPPAEDSFKLIIEQFPAISEIVSTTYNGIFSMSVRDAIPRGVTRTIAYSGKWEQEEIGLLDKYIRDGDLVIDLGANIGWHTIAAARKSGKQGCVVAFEPEPYNFSLLKRNLIANGLFEHCRLLNMAVADATKNVLFEKSDYNYGDHRVRYQEPISQEGYYHEHKRETMLVNAVTLDGALTSEFIGDMAADLYKRKGIRLMKIDTQGSEFKILKGADSALRNTEYLIMEFWPYGLKRAGDSAEELLDLVFKYFDCATLIDTPAWPLTYEDRQIVYNYKELMKLKDRITMADHFDLLFFRSDIGESQTEKPDQGSSA